MFEVRKSVWFCILFSSWQQQTNMTHYKVNQGLHILYQPNGLLSIGTYPVHRISMCLGFAANAAKKKVIVSYMNIFYVYSRDQMFQQITEQIIKILKCCITQIFGKVRRWGTVKIAFTVTRQTKNLKGWGILQLQVRITATIKYSRSHQTASNMTDSITVRTVLITKG